MAMARYVGGLVLQVAGLGATLASAVYFFDSTLGMGRLLYLFAAGVACFACGRFLMRPFRGEGA